VLAAVQLRRFGIATGEILGGCSKQGNRSCHNRPVVPNSVKKEKKP